MSNLMFPILTGYSISLMDGFDKYRANAIALINAANFPADVTTALRQQLNKDISDLVDLVAKNPPAPVFAPVETAVELPQLTKPNVVVFASDVTAPVTGTPVN